MCLCAGVCLRQHIYTGHAAPEAVLETLASDRPNEPPSGKRLSLSPSWKKSKSDTFPLSLGCVRSPEMSLFPQDNEL